MERGAEFHYTTTPTWALALGPGSGINYIKNNIFAELRTHLNFTRQSFPTDSFYSAVYGLRSARVLCAVFAFEITRTAKCRGKLKQLLQQPHHGRKQYEIIIMTISVNCHFRRGMLLSSLNYNLPSLVKICILNEFLFAPLSQRVCRPKQIAAGTIMTAT